MGLDANGVPGQEGQVTGRAGGAARAEPVPYPPDEARMARMRWRTAVVVGVAVFDAVGMWAPVPTSSLGAADVPALWGAERPADLVELAVPSGLTSGLDAHANSFANLVFPPGPKDAVGCGEVGVGPDPADALPVIEADDTEIDFSRVTPILIDTAHVCDGPLGPQTLLEVSGAVGAGDPVGRVRFVFARPAADEPFERVAIEYGTPTCTTVGAVDGFPGDASGVDDYVFQAWNFAGDASVDCSSRSLGQEATTTTSSTTSVDSTTTAPSTTTSTAPAATVPATGAQPVAGSPAYTG